MQPLLNTLPIPLQQLVRMDLSEDQLLDHLAQPTDATCPYCGQQALRRWEQLNGRCDRCRLAALEAIREPDQPTPDEDCPDCFGTGRLSQRAESGLRRCPCTPPRAGEMILEKLRLAGVPEKYWACTWVTWSGTVPNQRRVRDFTTAPIEHGTLFVWGLQGRGKTHLATAVFRDLLGRGLRCEWRDCGELVESCRRWISRDDDDALDTEILKLRTAEIVLLDDLGSRRQTDYAEDLVDGVIRWRHARNRPMIVTCNRSLEGLVQPVERGGLGRDPATVSRLRGASVEVDGPDRRRSQ